MYAVLGLPIGVALFAFTVTTVAFSAGLLVTFVGLPLLAVTGLISRTLGQMSRRLANRLAGGDVAPPQPFHANPGLLGWIGSPEEAFSDRAIRATRRIRNCAGVTIGFVAVGVVILMFVGEERPPAVFMGLLATLVFLTIGASASAFEGLLRGAVERRAETI